MLAGERQNIGKLQLFPLQGGGMMCLQAAGSASQQLKFLCSRQRTRHPRVFHILQFPEPDRNDNHESPSSGP